MRKYEVMVLIDSDVDERQAPALVDKHLAVITKDGGTIRFDAGNRPGADAQHIVICYRIKDTGIGMSEEFQKKLFDEFAQEENGAYTDRRDSDNIKLVSQYHNNWEALK